MDRKWRYVTEELEGGAFIPGPWKATAVQTEWPKPASGSTWTIGTDTTGIAVVEDARRREYGPPSGTAEAHAHLIAAAPTLLEACERIISVYEGMETGDGEPCPDLAFARAAIAAARNQTT